ncbi:MAG TPA: MFS transporter [Bdellovibrionales bacterium]|nr:MAG: MFS transporter [Bdellovibrionales bacterium GWB1_52_6]OFZ04862.1 MAG: MFS transporter [Bdellovibrionales bacterium GWA1_52_35]OFZ38337.1 MAG: MFS transporter [Bdellovibrionales bacterium GWC1_52_8]HAR44395.1 MFS transporter [Bdellovibrionales bacterium]HCM38948.1 MFS transporter [Bdellovibrionales bacterium]
MIQVTHLTKMYGPRVAVNDLNFEVKKGEIVGFLGPNGAGKSTTMKILTGFMPATQGQAVVDGHDVFENPIEVKRNVGFLPENPPVYPEMQVFDYLEFAARMRQVPKGSVSASVKGIIDKTGLGEVQHRLIGNLSKGFRQRVGLAQALVHNPKVLILDEPTVGLDPKQIIEIRELIKNLGNDHTVILSSHILPEVTATCQRIIIINKGAIVAEDTIERLTTRLNKGLIYNLMVKNPAAEGIAALRKIQGISNITPAGPKLIIEMTPGGQEIRDKIIETAVQKSMGVLEFSAERVSLEEIFLQLTTTENATGDQI